MQNEHNSRSWRYGLLLLGVLLVLAFAFQGSRGIWAPDEGYYVSLSQAMVETGDYLIPRLHHEPWLDKPPLSLWGVAGGLRLLGQNEWGARAFHGLCYVVTVWLVYLLGCALGSRREGLLGGAIYATMVIPFAAANVVTPDTPLGLWTTAAFVCFWKSVEPAARRVAWWKLLMCAAFGLGFLTKGPAVLIPSGAMFVFLLLRKQTWRYFLTPWALPGLALFGVLGLGWYAYVAHELPGAAAYFLKNQVVGRTISAEYARNAGLHGALIYLPVVLAGTLPWSLLWWPALWRRRKQLFRKATWRSLVDDPAALLLAVWIAIPLLVLCLASSKLPLYALPVFPALALATARMAVWRSPVKVWRGNPLALSPKMLGCLAVWLLVLVGLKAAGAHHPSEKDMRTLYQSIKYHLPADTYEIISVDDHYEGLGFYDSALVERVSTKKKPYSFFVLPESLGEEIAELGASNYAHVFLCEKEKRAKQLRELLGKANVSFKETPLSFRRYMFVCESSRTDRPVVRLVALGDAGKGKGKARQFSVASALWLRYAESSFDDGVILLGDNLYCGEEADAADLAAVAHRQFEEPFADLLKAGVPFYAVSGNHDTEYGLEAFELQYPAFNMKGRHYYSQVFGGGLVEVFILNSNVLRKGSDAKQIAWLQDALARSTAPWKVAALHNPIYSTATKFPTDPHLIAQLEDTFRQSGVSLVLQGHNHVYERLAPIHGIHYITAGSGGTVNVGDLSNHSLPRLAGNDQTEVFLMLEFDERACRLRAYDSMGKTVDDATIEIPSETK